VTRIWRASAPASTLWIRHCHASTPARRPTVTGRDSDGGGCDGRGRASSTSASAPAERRISRVPTRHDATALNPRVTARRSTRKTTHRRRTAHSSRGRVCPNVQFYAKKCAVPVLICAVLTTHLCSYNLQQRDATPRTPLGELTALLQTSWLDFGERKRRGKG